VMITEAAKSYPSNMLSETADSSLYKVQLPNYIEEVETTYNNL